MAQAANVFERHVFRNRLRRTVRFATPIYATRQDIEGLHADHILDAMAQNDADEYRFLHKGGAAFLRWSPVAEHRPDGSVDSSYDGMLSIPRASEMEATAIDVAYDAIYNQDLEDKVVKSMRGSIRRKSGQAPRDAQYILAVRVEQLGHERVAQTIANRILTNSIYEWISGIIVFRPMRSWDIKSPAALLELAVNEKATTPIRDHLRKMLRGEITIRLAR
jgi:hypothetical protein